MKNLERFKENNSSKSKDLTNASTRVDALKTVNRRKSDGRMKAKQSSDGENFKHESLILAQDERWRRA